MERSSSVWNKVCAVVVICAAAFHLYRAWTLPITTDEAFTFNRFVSTSWRESLTVYDANNHVLHTILAKLSVSLFGTSEFALRIPALLGGFLYLLLAWRLPLRIWGGPAALASCVWLTTLPHIAEYLSLARGYSLALAFWMLAFRLSLDERPALTRVSLLLGLSIAANLVFVVPAAALGLVLLIRDRDLPALAAPAAAVLACTVSIPLLNAPPNSFYFGASSLADSIRALLTTGFQRWTALAILLSAGLAAVRQKDARTLGALLALCALSVALLYKFAGIPLPYQRTGIYLLALLGLLAGAACRHGRAELPIAAILVVFGLSAANQVTAARSAPWPDDPFVPQAMTFLAGREAAPRVAGSMTLHQSCEFYRRIRKLPWPEVQEWRPGYPADYVIWSTGRPLPDGFGVIHRDPRYSVVVAKRVASIAR